MDVINVTNEGNTLDSGKKKYKKRKNKEISDLGGEELADGGTKKVLGEDVNAQVYNNRREGNMRRGKTGEIVPSDEKDHDKGTNEEHAREGHMKEEEEEEEEEKNKTETKYKQNLSVDSVKKKNKKRKNGEISDLGGEELADGGTRKNKVKVLSDVNAEVDNNKREGKMRKGKIGGVFVDSNEKDHDKGTSEKHARERHMKEKEKKEKEKNKRETKNKQNPNDDVGDTNFVANQNYHEVNETAQPLNYKKQKNKKEDLGDGFSNKRFLGIRLGHAFGYSEDTQIGGDSNKKQLKKKKKNKTEKCKDVEFAGADIAVGHASSVENQADHEVIEKVKLKNGQKRIKKKDKIVDPSENSNGNKKSKKVKFSENVEVFPLPDNASKGKKKLEDGSKENKNNDDGLIQGKRFSKEEDEIIQNAVFKYIEDHQLGELGVEMIMNCRAHPEVKNCWKEIGEALPRRPYSAVYYRAHVLFEQSDTRTWSPEEIELVKKFHEKHGPDWKILSVELGKHRFHVKDAWRRHKYPKKGNWSQEEYQNLFDLVNVDLSMKAFTEKKTKHGMLRDNICWEAISDQLATRSNSICCLKWYNQLISPMVAEGKWSNADDYRLLIALNDLDAACEEEVDWDNLFEHRTGDVCRKRWHQMVHHIGENGTKSFGEQVEILSQRYCPDLLESREAYDCKPPVD